MNHNTGEINRIAEEVAKLVQERIGQKRAESQGTQTIADFELAFREVVRQIGATALGLF